MTRQHTLYAFLLAGLATVALIVTPIAASALMMDKGTYGYCKSGQRVTNAKQCKENGGRK